MSKVGGKIIIILLMSILLGLMITSGAFGGSSSSEMSGRMAVTYNEDKGTATGMVAGYCQGEPVTIGPATVRMNQKEFSNTKVEDIGKNICGDDYSIRRVTRSSNNGREMVADVVLVRNKEEDHMYTYMLFRFFSSLCRGSVRNLSCLFRENPDAPPTADCENDSFKHQIIMAKDILEKYFRICD